VPHKDAKRAESTKPKLATRELVPENRDFETDKGSNFKNHGYAKREMIKPTKGQLMPTGGPFEGKSVMRTEFQLHEGARPEKSCKPVQKRELTVEDRDFKSANSDFDAKTDFPVRAKAPEAQTHIEGLPFEGSSVARTDFHAFPGARPEKAIKPKPVVLVAPKEDRDFKSVARDTFQPLGYHKREPFAPKARGLEHSAPFEATSNYRNEFAKHEGHVKVQPIKPKPSAFESAGKFEGTSTHADDFKHHKDARPSKTTKPAPNKVTHQGEDRTFNSEHRSEFTKKNVERCPSDRLKERRVKSAPGHKFYVQDSGRWTPEANWLQRTTMAAMGQTAPTGNVALSTTTTVSTSHQLSATHA
jgi:hypothetical protein